MSQSVGTGTLTFTVVGAVVVEVVVTCIVLAWLWPA
jgi:hypothetical protein